VAMAGRDRWRPRRIVLVSMRAGRGPCGLPDPSTSIVWFGLDGSCCQRNGLDRPLMRLGRSASISHLLFRHYLDQRVPQDACDQMQVQLSSLDVWQILRKTDRRARRISSSHFLLQRPLSNHSDDDSYCSDDESYPGLSFAAICLL
jgi:hypothetical protein